MNVPLIFCFLAWWGTGLLYAADFQIGPVERPAGTGVIVHRDGYVLTAHHVVATSRRIVVVTPGEFRAPAVTVAADPDQDLALLKIDTVGLSEAPIGYAGAVKLDEEVVVVGYPFGLREVSIAHGHIAAVRTKGVKRVFQVDAAINPGNSGGPLFNRHGEVVGLITTKFSHPSGIVPEGMAFAVPISYALPLLVNIPDFDFQSVGKGRRERPRTRKGNRSEDILRVMSRTTVRIEVLRTSAESQAASTGAAESRPDRRTPEPRAAARPDTAREESGKEPADQIAVAKVNEELRSAQLRETHALAERGIVVPDGMVLIPAGEFIMGDEQGHPDARPMHKTLLSAYWIDRHEVTNAQYRQCVDGGICMPPKDRQVYDDAERARHPVTNVTWKQAHAYCQWLGRRLPTEAEWEKAARGTDGRRYPWGNSEELLKSRSRNPATTVGLNGTSPVGSVAEAASPYGVFDLVGNVWEWVKDWYAEDYYATAPRLDPQGPLRGSFRVLRGGDWSQNPLELRASTRAWDEMTYWGPTLGFRCAADAP